MLEDLVLDVMNRMIEEQVRFKMKYPDYPLSLEKLDTETCIVSASDIPSGSGGINGERYTYGQLCHQPIIPELMKNPKTAQAVKEHRVTAAMIRAVTYDLLREELGRCCGISKEEAGLAIGNQLDCAPHEDGSGYIFMVPNWAHKWFRHDGYVSKMLSEMNQ